MSSCSATPFEHDPGSEADPQMVGQPVNLEGETYTIIGVLPPRAPLERGRARIWTPLTFAPANMTRNFHWFGSIARLKPGVTLEQARTQMDAIGQRIAHDFPDSNKGWSVGVDLLADTIAGAGLKKVAPRPLQGRGDGAADRLRQPGQSLAHARGGARA